MKRASPELALQKAVMAFLKLALPRDAFCTAFPAEGGAGGFRRGVRMKASGLVPGCPDIWLVFNGWLFCIELKFESGRLSDKQVACHARLTDAGARVATCRNIDDVAQALTAWAVPIRAHPLSQKTEAG